MSKISAISRRNSGRIENSRLSASIICLTRDSSLTSVNIWLLVRVFDCGLISASRVQIVDSGILDRNVMD